MGLIRWGCDESGAPTHCNNAWLQCVWDAEREVDKQLAAWEGDVTDEEEGCVIRDKALRA